MQVVALRKPSKDGAALLAGRQTFPVTVGAIQFISYVGSDGRGSLVAIVPQLLLSLSVQKYIVRGLTGHPAYTASPPSAGPRRRPPATRRS